MEFDFSIFEKQGELNGIAREKYERLVLEEKQLNNSPSGRRITQAKIAKQIGLSDSMISFWLKGERQLSIESVMRMLDTLLNEAALLNLRKEAEMKQKLEVRANRRNKVSN